MDQDPLVILYPVSLEFFEEIILGNVSVFQRMPDIRKKHSVEAGHLSINADARRHKEGEKY